RPEQYVTRAEPPRRSRGNLDFRENSFVLIFHDPGVFRLLLPLLQPGPQVGENIGRRGIGGQVLEFARVVRQVVKLFARAPDVRGYGPLSERRVTAAENALPRLRRVEIRGEWEVERTREVEDVLVAPRADRTHRVVIRDLVEDEGAENRVPP